MACVEVAVVERGREGGRGQGAYKTCSQQGASLHWGKEQAAPSCRLACNHQAMLLLSCPSYGQLVCGGNWGGCGARGVVEGLRRVAAQCCRSMMLLLMLLAALCCSLLRCLAVSLGCTFWLLRYSAVPAVPVGAATMVVTAAVDADARPASRQNMPVKSMAAEHGE
ncbi:hypothetical protein V8C86DRAFT_331081 [Haematococcus lacustris]